MAFYGVFTSDYAERLLVFSVYSVALMQGDQGYGTVQNFNSYNWRTLPCQQRGKKKAKNLSWTRAPRVSTQSLDVILESFPRQIPLTAAEHAANRPIRPFLPELATAMRPAREPGGTRQRCCRVRWCHPDCPRLRQSCPFR